MKQYKILTEASGSLTSGYLIKAIKEAGHLACGSDVSAFNFAKVLCDDFIVFPKKDDKNLWQKIETLLLEHKVEVVIPSFDEMMEGWAQRAEYFASLGINVIISPLSAIEICQDKWKTYEFFEKIGINTPKTSLEPEYPLIKPRLGRGSAGIFEQDFESQVDMAGMISQEKLSGQEYTVDVFFDKNSKPVYIIPRRRIDVKEGKSTKGEVVCSEKIDELIKKISRNINFVGPINFQLFETSENEFSFIEINPRIAGGMALAFYASENWIDLIVKNIVENNPIEPKEINYNAKMMRYYAECFI